MNSNQLPITKQGWKKLFNYWLLMMGIWLLVMGSGSLAEELKVVRIEAKRDRGFDYLDIYTTGYIKAKGLLLEDRLLINLPNSRIASDLEVLRGESKRIKDISVKQLSGEAVQIIVELKKDIDYEIVNLFGRNKSVVEVSDRLDYTARLMAAWEKANLKRKGEALKPYKYEPMLTSKDQSLRGKVVVIDPGHGGRDPGAISLNGIPEKILTLNTARKAAQHLSAAGATVYLTRAEDRSLNLADIVDFANRIDADIFISIHYNFANNKSISGTETYYYNRMSRNLALAIHQSLIHGIKRKDRGLRRTMFYTIHHTQMPAVLIEPLYLSNPEEEKLVSSSYFQDEIARDVTRGIKAYFRSKSG